MKKNLSVFALSTATLFIASLCQTLPVRAQMEHQHQHDPAEQLGRVNFEVSCTPEARRQFNRAVAWLHSFEYEEAEKAFAEVTVNDPRCGMGFWGVAMSNYHPLWAPPTASELQRGLKAAEQARSVGARTQRERDYIAAVETFYKDADRLDHRARANAYGEAIAQLSQRYPSDTEAGVFYALTLIAKGAAAGDKTYATDKHPVTPSALLPAREQLGELLLELKQPAEALNEFEASLQTAPNRFNGLYGAARAAVLAGDRKRAEGFYKQLVALCSHADTERPELKEAKEFLAGGGTKTVVSSQ